MPTIQIVLNRKGSDVATISRDKSVLDAAKLMNNHRIGAVVITDGENAVGIFTERDILCRIVAEGLVASDVMVGVVMTSPMACCRRDTTLSECRRVMTEKRIRHLPVVEDGTLHGMISAGDVLATEVMHQQETIEYLNEYLYGRS